MLPYATVEYYEQLKNTMRTYRKVVADKQDTRPVEAEIIFLAGISGPFCCGWIAAAAYDDAVQRVDGAKPEWIYGGT